MGNGVFHTDFFIHIYHLKSADLEYMKFVYIAYKIILARLARRVTYFIIEIFLYDLQ
jgi:hypothetical protein